MTLFDHARVCCTGGNIRNDNVDTGKGRDVGSTVGTVIEIKTVCSGTGIGIDCAPPASICGVCFLFR